MMVCTPWLNWFTHLSSYTHKGQVHQAKKQNKTKKTFSSIEKNRQIYRDKTGQVLLQRVKTNKKWAGDALTGSQEKQRVI